MWQLVVLCNKILIKVVGYQLYPNYTLYRMEKNIFVISTILLGIVVVALLFTIATLQSENSDLRNQTNNSIYVNR
jgi:hypothetical protein